jgi:carnitine O-acetyltransferase
MRQSTWFRLSTSGLSSGDLYNGTGFGCVVPDGYGVNYCIGKKKIKMGIESKKSCRETSTIRFKHALWAAYADIKKLCEQQNGSSKL